MSQFRLKTWSFAVLFGFVIAGCGPGGGPEPTAPPEPAAGAETPTEPDEPEGTPVAVIDTEKGAIVIKLRPDLAPKTVENFVSLAREGFYYRSAFHRVIPDTIIQGGDPNSKDENPYNDGQGNSGKFIPAEFSKEPFQRGTVAMARQPQNPDSASCQFFICLKRMQGWDGEYTVFGEVIEGIEIVEQMSNAPRSKDPRLKERPAGRLTIKNVKIEYRQL